MPAVVADVESRSVYRIEFETVKVIYSNFLYMPQVPLISHFIIIYGKDGYYNFPISKVKEMVEKYGP